MVVKILADPAVQLLVIRISQNAPQLLAAGLQAVGLVFAVGHLGAALGVRGVGVEDHQVLHVAVLDQGESLLGIVAQSRGVQGDVEELPEIVVAMPPGQMVVIGENHVPALRGQAQDPGMPQVSDLPVPGDLAQAGVAALALVLHGALETVAFEVLLDQVLVDFPQFVEALAVRVRVSGQRKLFAQGLQKFPLRMSRHLEQAVGFEQA